MKNNVFNAGISLAILIIILFANNVLAQSADETTKPKTITLTLSVTAMDCQTDSKMVETSLYRKKGIKSIKIAEDIITVVYNPANIKPEEIIAVIENTGTCEDPSAKVHKVKIKTF